MTVVCSGGNGSEFVITTLTGGPFSMGVLLNDEFHLLTTVLFCCSLSAAALGAENVGNAGVTCCCGIVCCIVGRVFV